MTQDDDGAVAKIKVAARGGRESTLFCSQRAHRAAGNPTGDRAGEGAAEEARGTAFLEGKPRTRYAKFLRRFSACFSKSPYHAAPEIYPFP